MDTTEVGAHALDPEQLARRTYTVTEAATILGISRSTAYACVRTSELQSIRLRGRIVIPTHALRSLLEDGFLG